MNSSRKQKAASAIRFAFIRLVAVAWGGFVALGLYLAIIILGPSIEGKYFPVIEDYTLTEIRQEPSGAISFVPIFTKVRDCTYYGVSWFAPDENGNLARMQVSPLGEDPTAPRTGPLGPRAGARLVITPPEGATSVIGVMNHDCGMIWQTRTPVGPYDLSVGKLSPTARGRG